MIKLINYIFNFEIIIFWLFADN